MNFITLQFHNPNDTVHLWFTVIHLTCALLLDDKIKPHSVQTRKSVNFQQIEFTQNPVYFGQNLVDFQTANRFHSKSNALISLKSVTDFTRNPTDFSEIHYSKSNRFHSKSNGFQSKSYEKQLISSAICHSHEKFYPKRKTTCLLS